MVAVPSAMRPPTLLAVCEPKLTASIKVAEASPADSRRYSPVDERLKLVWLAPSEGLPSAVNTDHPLESIKLNPGMVNFFRPISPGSSVKYRPLSATGFESRL